MRNAIGHTAVGLIRFAGLFARPKKLQNKAVIISRQADEPTIDIRLLADKCIENGVDISVLAKTLKKTPKSAISYCGQLLKQIHALATSKVVLLDGYCIPASVLPKKKGQTIIQMWHAMGAVKKFGWQTVNKADGTEEGLANIMCMHANYDVFFAPGKVTGEIFAEAFRTPKEKMRYFLLPRVDYLRTEDAEKNAQILGKYPSVSEKTNVLYVPTFRKNAALDVQSLVSHFDFAKANLIIKKHFLDKEDYSWAIEQGAIVDSEFSSMEWLRICEKVVTDYSAISFEAAILEKELYIYQPDAEAYADSVGLNVDMQTEAIADYVCSTPEELAEKLKTAYDKEAVLRFKEKYIEADVRDCSGQICDFIRARLSE